MTWATRITVLRLLLIPVFVGFLVEQESVWQKVGPRAGETWRLLAFSVFTLAALSDALDGFLARYCNQRSALGALLDPIADKLLLFAALLLLGVFYPKGMVPLPLILVIMIIGRDAILLVGYLLLKNSRKAVEVRPHWAGKLSTFAIFLAIEAVLLQWTAAILPLSLIGVGAAAWGFLRYVQVGWSRWRGGSFD